MAQQIAVSTSVQEVFEGNPPGKTNTELLKAILGGGSIVDAIISDYTNTPSFRQSAVDYYDYGYKTDKLGVPTAYNFSINDETEYNLRPEVGAIIAAADGVSASNIHIMTLEVGYVNKLAIFLESLQDGTNYSMSSGSLSIGNRTYIPRNPRWASTSATSLSELISAEDEFGESWETEYVTGGIGYRSDDTIFFTVRYYWKDGTPGKTDKTGYSNVRYWTYENGSNINAPYDAINISPDLLLGGKYYPIVPIRVNGVWIDDSSYFIPTVPAVTTMLQYLGLNFTDIKAAVTPPPAVLDNDPELEDIKDVVGLFAVDMSLTDDIFNRYLFQTLLGYHYTIGGATEQEWDTWNAHNDRDTIKRPRNLIEIRTSAVVFRMEYSYSTVQVRTGNINTDGVYSGPAPTNQPTGIFTGGGDYLDEPLPEAGEVVKIVNISTVPLDEPTNSTPFRHDKLLYRKPLSGTPGSYIEVELFGLQGVYDVMRNGWQEEGQFFVRMDDWTNGNLVLPISKDIVELFPKEMQEELLYRSFQIMVYARQFYDLSFLQGNLFKFLFFVFQVFAIWIPGMMFLGNLLKSAALIGWIATAQLLLAKITFQAIANYIIQMVVLTLIFALVIEIVGLDAAMYMYAFFLVASASTSLIGGTFGGLGTAEELLQAVGAFDMAISFHMKNDYMNLLEEMDDIDKSRKELDEEIERQADGLSDKDPNSLSSLDILNAKMANSANENITRYYNRTIHNKNPGVLSLLGPAMYCDMSKELPLPEFNLGTRFA
jgi:hypothetical protein